MVNSTDNKSKSSFGIGCFHFGMKEGATSFQGTKYIREIKRILESIPSVDNVNIKYDFLLEEHVIKHIEKASRLDETLGCFPNPLRLDVFFDVSIPKRIQSQLLKPFSIGNDLPEKFSVSIFYTYHLPVAFIRPINPPEKYDPAHSVVIVREFLKSELKKISSDYIIFETLGPSPFHADCYIQLFRKPSLNKIRENTYNIDVAYYSDIKHYLGYDRIIFYASHTRFKNLTYAQNFIMHEIQNELGFFYSIVQWRNFQSYRWDSIQLNMHNITASKSDTFRARIGNFFTRKDIVKETLNLLIEFRGMNINFRWFYQKYFRNIYPLPSFGHFQKYIREEFEDRPNYPVKEASDLINFYENRRAATIQNFLLVISAVFGGVIGSLVTLNFNQL